MKSTPFVLRSWPLEAARLALVIVTLFSVSGCAGPPPESAGAEKSPPTEKWDCRNDLEVRCGQGGCEATTQDGFTPMSVNVDDSGAMSVCAYSGCWEGVGEVVRSDNFLALIGHGLQFSTAPDPEAAKADILIAIDRTDNVAVLKGGGFAHPLLCERSVVETK